MPPAELLGAVLALFFKELADTNRRYRRTPASDARARRRRRRSRGELAQRVGQLEDDLVPLLRLHLALGRSLEETGGIDPQRFWQVLREVGAAERDAAEGHVAESEAANRRADRPAPAPPGAGPARD